MNENEVHYKFRVWQPVDQDALVGAFIKYEHVDGKWRSFTLTPSQGWREFQAFEVLDSHDTLFNVGGVTIHRWPEVANALEDLDGVKWVQ